MTKLRRSIVCLLADFGLPMRTAEIAAFLHVPEERIIDAVRALSERGEIVKDGPYWVRGKEAS